MAGPHVYDHLSPTDENDRTVYRVVGVGDERVTLLRLTDRAGTREATGELRYVAPADLDREFEPSSDPDPRFAWPDYLAILFVITGVGMVVFPETDLVSGSIMALAGAYLLVRRQHWTR